MLDKDECVLAEAEDIIEQISCEAKYEGFTDEEQLLNRLYADSVGVDAVVIPSDLKSSDSISFASAIAEKFSDTEIIFSTLPCEAKEIERLFLSGYKLRPFAVIVKPLNKTVLTPIINSLIEAKSVKRNAIMVSAGRTHTLYRTADIIMVKSEKRKIRSDKGFTGLYLRADTEDKTKASRLFCNAARKLSDKCKLHKGRRGR